MNLDELCYGVYEHAGGRSRPQAKAPACEGTAFDGRFLRGAQGFGSDPGGSFLRRPGGLGPTPWARLEFSQLSSSSGGSPASGEHRARRARPPARPAEGLGWAAAGADLRGPRCLSQSGPFQPHDLSLQFPSCSCPRKHGILLIISAADDGIDKLYRTGKDLSK